MFENMTFDVIMDRMLAQIPDTVDKRQGSIIYDALMPAALEMEQLYINMDMIMKESYADTASYYYLIKKAAEHGVYPEAGKAAVLKVQVSPTDVALEMGTVLNIGELNYTVTEALGEGAYSITCEESGVEGNNTAADVIPMDYVEGLDSIEVVSIISPGTEDEEEEELRSDYYGSFEASAFGGNVKEYQLKVNKMDGVGGCKIDPAWNGKVTDPVNVNVYLISSNYGVADASLVESVQNTLDPKKDGLGFGLVPIGHVVTVKACTAVPVNIALKLEYQTGSEWEDVSESVSQAIESYLSSLRECWDTDDHGLLVRKSAVESAVLSVTGVVDVFDVTLNESDDNLVLGLFEIPVMGVLSHG